MGVNGQIAVTLENDLVRLRLDPRTGGFGSLYDKRFGHEYILAPDRALLLRMMLPEDGAEYRHLDGAEPQITVNGNTAAVAYRFGNVFAVASLTLDGETITAQISITNAGTVNIEEVMFPWVRGLGPIVGASFIWPHFWKRKYDDLFGNDLGGDHHTWNEWTQKLVGRYPCHLTTAWCDYGTQDHGIAIESLHTDFSIVDFFIHKIVEKTHDPIRRTLDFCTVRPRRIKPGETVSFPPVRILLHQGDWHTVADAHRDWLETWIQKPDRPAKFAESIGWHFFFMKHQDGLVRATYADLPDLARAALAAGCSYLMVFGWQTGGHDNNYFYRYVPNDAWGGQEALRQALAQCRAMGVEVLPFFNGTLANVQMPEHKQFGHRWEAKTRSGHAYYGGDWARHNADAPSRNRSMLHTEIAFCKEQRAYFLASMKRIVQDYGFGNTQLDQISEKMFVDYNEEHITTTPDRVYVDGLMELLPAVRRLLREVNPEGVMVSEALNDFTGQWCDSSWDWTTLLPFPEPILYTLPWLMTSHEIDALEYKESNIAFAYKMHFDLKIDGGDAPITKYPEFTQHVKGLAELRRRTAAYLAQADFRDEEGVKGGLPENVIVKVYRNQTTLKRALVLAEVAGMSAQVTLPACGQDTHSEAVAFSSQGTTEVIEASGPILIKMDPYEVKVVCLDPATEAAG